MTRVVRFCASVQCFLYVGDAYHRSFYVPVTYSEGSQYTHVCDFNVCRGIRGRRMVVEGRGAVVVEVVGASVWSQQ